MQSLSLPACLRCLHLLLQSCLLLSAQPLRLEPLAQLNPHQLHTALGDDHPHAGLDLCDAPQVAAVAPAGNVATAAALEVEDAPTHEAVAVRELDCSPRRLEPHEATPHLSREEKEERKRKRK